MNKKITLGLAISLIAIASAVTFILTSFFSLQSFNKKVVDVNEKAKKYDAIQDIDSYVRANYYGNIDEEALNNGILKGYAAGVGDPYAEYLTADEYQLEKSEEAGKLVGIGLTLAEDESGYIRIDEIMQDSPVIGSGLEEGDIITYVDGTDVQILGFDNALEAMRGQEGTDITITVRRDGVDTDMIFTRRSIEVKTVDYDLLNNSIGYISISGFKENTPQQFISAIESLTANGAKALIFDVRDNEGGLIPALEECLDPLLPEGVVATAEFKDGRSETIVYSDSSEIDLPMAVLVNKQTASSAELFAAALRDGGKAVLVGEQTFGKGVMQVTNEFDNGSALKLTVAKYRTSVSESYDKIGLVPDYIAVNESEDTDLQYSKAVEVLSSMLG